MRTLAEEIKFYSHTEQSIIGVIMSSLLRVIFSCTKSTWGLLPVDTDRCWFNSVVTCETLSSSLWSRIVLHYNQNILYLYICNNVNQKTTTPNSKPKKAKVHRCPCFDFMHSWKKNRLASPLAKLKLNELWWIAGLPDSLPLRSKLSSRRMQTRARNLVTSFRYSTVVLLSLMMAMDSLS